MGGIYNKSSCLESDPIRSNDAIWKALISILQAVQSSGTLGVE
jgi:hypothetical protein